MENFSIILSTIALIISGLSFYYSYKWKKRDTSISKAEQFMRTELTANEIIMTVSTYNSMMESSLPKIKEFLDKEGDGWQEYYDSYVLMNQLWERDLTKYQQTKHNLSQEELIVYETSFKSNFHNFNVFFESLKELKATFK